MESPGHIRYLKVKNMLPEVEISLFEVRSYFSGTIFNRGVAYYRDGRAKIIELTESGLVAQVRGSTLYTVMVAFADDGWEMECDCPYSYGCKHMVAALLEARDVLKERKRMPQGQSGAPWKTRFAALLQNRSKDYVDSEPTWQVGFILKTLGWSWQISAKKFLHKKDGTLGRYENLDVWSLSGVWGETNAFRALAILSKMERQSQYSGYYHSSYEATLRYGQYLVPLL